MKPNLARDIVAVSDFRKRTSTYLQEINKGGRTVILTQNGRSAAVVLSPAAFEQVEYERDLFAAIAKGEREIEQGLGIPHEAVFREIFAHLKSS